MLLHKTTAVSRPVCSGTQTLLACFMPLSKTEAQGLLEVSEVRALDPASLSCCCTAKWLPQFRNFCIPSRQQFSSSARPASIDKGVKGVPWAALPCRQSPCTWNPRQAKASTVIINAPRQEISGLAQVCFLADFLAKRHSWKFLVQDCPRIRVRDAKPGFGCCCISCYKGTWTRGR